MQEAGPGNNLPAGLEERISATRLALGENVERLAASRIQLRETLQSLRTSRTEREMLHEVAYARLLAKLQSMPVIEQAKGILMAESRCTAEEAFAMLRAASQRSNLKVRDLAQEIVARVAGSEQEARLSQSSAADSLPDG
jgi:hypothetical protein